MKGQKAQTTIKLSESEALILFEFLTRFSEQKKLEIIDRAEERILWDIQCLLEKQLVAPLKTDYAEALIKARTELRDRR